MGFYTQDIHSSWYTPSFWKSFPGSTGYFFEFFCLSTCVPSCFPLYSRVPERVVREARAARKKPGRVGAISGLLRNIYSLKSNGDKSLSDFRSTVQGRPLRVAQAVVLINHSLMAIYLSSSNPSELLTAFKKKIRDRAIVTWLEKDGYFTHDTDQWRYKAWLKPSVGNGRLIFNIVNSTGSTVTTLVYGIYHGRIIESMLCHFDKDVSSTEATPMPASGDVLS